MGADPKESRSIPRKMYIAALQPGTHEGSKQPEMAARILVTEVAVGILTPSKPASLDVTMQHESCPNFEQGWESPEKKACE
jgi:hypothetical protein